MGEGHGGVPVGEIDSASTSTGGRATVRVLSQDAGQCQLIVQRRNEAIRAAGDISTPAGQGQCLLDIAAMYCEMNGLEGVIERAYALFAGHVQQCYMTGRVSSSDLLWMAVPWWQMFCGRHSCLAKLGAGAGVSLPGITPMWFDEALARDMSEYDGWMGLHSMAHGREQYAVLTEYTIGEFAAVDRLTNCAVEHLTALDEQQWAAECARLAFTIYSTWNADSVANMLLYFYRHYCVQMIPYQIMRGSFLTYRNKDNLHGHTD